MGLGVDLGGYRAYQQALKIATSKRTEPSAMSEMWERALSAYLANSLGSPPDQDALRAAILAAIEPEDEAMVAIILDEMDSDNSNGAVRALHALKAHAERA